MKRLLLFCVFCVFAFVANAQVRTFYYKDSGYWVKLDLTKKVFILDGCASEPMRVLNYKKTGNKESFTTTDNGLTTHNEFVKKSDTDYTYYYWTTPSESKEKAVIEVTTKPVTINRVEKGAPTVAIGIYLRVLYALQLDDDILLLAQKDDMGRALQDLALKHRERASKKE